MRDKAQWKDVIFYLGCDTDPLERALWLKLKEYLGEEPQDGHIRYGKFNDLELKDAIPNFEDMHGKTVVFFECLKSLETTIRLMQLCWAAKFQYGAKYIIVAASFLHYRRQDHPEKNYEIHRNKWLMEMLKHSGVDHMIVAAPHSDQTGKNCEEVGMKYQSVDFTEAFVSVCKPLLPDPEEKKKVLLYAPDVGSIPRAINFARYLGVDVAFGIKDRGRNNEVTIIDADQMTIDEIISQYDYDRLFFGTPELIKGAIVIMVDDEVTTGGTMNKRAKQLLQIGASNIMAFVSHPVCSHQWREILMDGDPFAKIVFMDTIFRGKEHRTGGMVHDVSAAGLIASVIYRELRKLFGRVL